MVGQRHWSHAEWKHDDESRLYLTLGFSVLMHAALLLAWKMPAPVWKAADHAVLTVVLRGAAPLAQSSPTTGEKADVAVLTRKEPAPAAFSMPPRPAASASTAPPVAPARPAAPPSRARAAMQPTPGHPANRNPAAVGVNVLLVVGGDGRVQQILWDQLPALTDEQLRRVEAVIRRKTYAAGQTLNEIVDVRSILQLPPARSEESPEPPLSLPQRIE